MRGIRIGLMTDTFLPVVDGVGRVVVAYANTLPKFGHEVTVSAPMYDTGHRGNYPFELVDFTGFSVPTTPQYRTGAAVMDAHYVKRMDMIDLDIVHSHSPFGAGKEALRLKRQRHIPLISTFHSKYYDDFLKVTKSETVAKAVVSNIVNYYKKCDDVWAVSHSSAEVLREYGFQGHIEVIGNGTEFRPKDHEAVVEVSRKFGLNEDPVLLFVGQINWKKNILRILEACSVLKEQNPRFQLVLAGQGPDTDKIIKKAQELGISDQLIMTGMIRDTRTLDALYLRADLFVFPSLYDTFSLVIREAAAMGTPSVAIAGSAAAESITDRVNGFLCEDTSQSLADVLIFSVNNRELLKKLGEEAFKSIPIPWETVLKTAVKRYEYVISQHQGKPRASHLRYKRMRARTNDQRNPF